ncbi:MAG: tetratricopeptide repeat protein [Meiothermus sp.]|nr:tetratricopeptide repeat protein [Meiothermus sp.]
MGEVSSAEFWSSFEVLIANGHLEVAIQQLQRRLENCTTHLRAKAFLSELQKLPAALLEQAGFESIYLQALCKARAPEQILSWLSERTPSPAALVYLSWAQVRQGSYQEALHTLQRSEPASPFDWGIFYRSKGEALFWTGQPGWLEVLEQSRDYLKGPSLGRMLLDAGFFLYHQGHRSQALVKWAEALAYLEEDPYYLAWAHNSLGMALLPDQPHKAERHLLQAFKLSKKAPAKDFRAKALSGIAAVRRSLGEWERALHSYQQASKGPGDLHDRQMALWGWGHTLRLMGQTEEALAKLTQAWQMNPAEVWLEADLLAARLMLGEAVRVFESIAHLKEHLASGRLSERGQVVLRVVEAEYARQRGLEEQARSLVAGLEASSLWVREELSCFPELARMAGICQTPRQIRVEVRPYGGLEVRVNGRPVPIPAVSKMGELLVFLLVSGGQASLEVLLDRLGNPRNRNPRKAFWENLEKLRQALGWKESVQNQGGVYTLDPRAEWICDLNPQNLPMYDPQDLSHTFMPGYYSDWVEEWRRQWLVV